MRKIFIFIWLLIPLGAAAYHFGPGQQNLKYDQVANHIDLAEQHIALEDFSAAVIELDKAIGSLPTEDISKITKLRPLRMRCISLAVFGWLRGTITHPPNRPQADQRPALKTPKTDMIWNSQKAAWRSYQCHHAIILHLARQKPHPPNQR